MKNLNLGSSFVFTNILWMTSLIGATVPEVAVPYDRPVNVPEASDVQMRTLRFRPMDAQDPQDTFRAMDQFHVTRLEWSYVEAYEPGTIQADSLADSLKQIERTKASGRLFGGASNASSGTFVQWDEVNGKHIKKYSIVDRSGFPVILGHMRFWKQPQSPGCVNNPAYQKGHLDYLKKYVDAGATAMQRDEPSTQVSYAQSGSGCFCEYCMKGFRDYLKKTLSAEELGKLGVQDIETFDYKEYLNKISPPPKTDEFDWSDPKTVKAAGGDLHKEFEKFQAASTVAFFKGIREGMQAHNGGVPIIYTCNNTSFQNWDDTYLPEFDYCISEMMMKSANPAHIYERSQVARKLGKLQVFGTPKSMGEKIDEGELVRLKQQVLATAYASGSVGSVPWDVFMQSKDGNARYFCNAEDFAPLFGFVRANDQYLSGYCTAGGKGPGFEDNPYSDGFPIQFTNENLCVTLRAVPGKKDEPVIVHLVDWSKGAGGPMTLKLKTDAFFPGKKLSVTLRAPKAYGAAAHAAAETAAQAMRKKDELLGPAQASAYEPLVQETALKTSESGEWVEVTIPALTPWGILVVKPQI